jgi:hypothetical protein
VSASAAREKRVIELGSAIVIVSLFVSYVALPFVRRWGAREDSIATLEARVAYLTEFASRQQALERAANAAEEELSRSTRRVVQARTMTLASNGLQSMLQGAVDASRLVSQRLEVAPEPTDDSTRLALEARAAGATSLTATLSAYGDISGVTTLLDLFATGARLAEIERLTMIRNSALAGAADVVQATMVVRAPVLVNGRVP